MTQISKALELRGNETYIFYRDVEKWDERTDIPPSKISEMAFVESPEKKIVLAIRKDIELRFLRVIADEVIEIDNINELISKLSQSQQ